MKVILAQPRGFCAGVVRAVEIVERALEGARAEGRVRDREAAPVQAAPVQARPVYVRHEIVHNARVVAGLEGKGAVFVEELAEVPDGATVVFSAHGVSRAVEDEARARGLPVVDATCPLVAKVHQEARRYAASGRAVILVGHAGHAEVEGTLGRIEGRAFLVGTAAEVAALPLGSDEPVAYVTQTTLSLDDTRAVIAAIKARWPGAVGPGTRDICYATQNRQAAVRDLAARADVILVVGAANSSNSCRLREIGEELGTRSYLLPDGAALDPAWVAGARVVGLTAGASAPEVLVQEVLARLRTLGAREVEALPGVEETIQFRLPPELSAA